MQQRFKARKLAHMLRGSMQSVWQAWRWSVVQGKSEHATQEAHQVAMQQLQQQAALLSSQLTEAQSKLEQQQKVASSATAQLLAEQKVAQLQGSLSSTEQQLGSHPPRRTFGLLPRTATWPASRRSSPMVPRWTRPSRPMMPRRFRWPRQHRASAAAGLRRRARAGGGRRRRLRGGAAAHAVVGACGGAAAGGVGGGRGGARRRRGAAPLSP